ncbi:hypothetical protein ACH4CE_32390, partial [Streptomyces gelaticus]
MQTNGVLLTGFEAVNAISFVPCFDTAVLRPTAAAGRRLPASRQLDGIAALLAQPAHPVGAWCRTTRWRPRTPNSMRDIDSFLARWNSADAPRPAVRLHTSAHGNINTVGRPGIHEADDLDPAHPQWHAAIEPGIRPLVDAVTDAWGLVTYDSCQGHPCTGL